MNRTRTEPTVLVIGVHSVRPTRELLHDAFELKYADVNLSPAQRDEAQRQILREIGGAALIEFVVENCDERFDVGDFGQEDSEQAPYEEIFLSLDGGTAIGDQPEHLVGRVRGAFFLHFIDYRAPLSTSYGAVELPPETPMPERLQRLVPYVPVD